eukprot:6460923-Amphidinium_carterae.1
MDCSQLHSVCSRWIAAPKISFSIHCHASPARTVTANHAAGSRPAAPGCSHSQHSAVVPRSAVPGHPLAAAPESPVRDVTVLSVARP